MEPAGEQVEAAASATSKSAVSRKFVAMTETALADLLVAKLSSLDLVAMMVDGVHFGEHRCVVALRIDIVADADQSGTIAVTLHLYVHLALRRSEPLRSSARPPEFLIVVWTIGTPLSSWGPRSVRRI